MIFVVIHAVLHLFMLFCSYSYCVVVIHVSLYLFMLFSSYSCCFVVPDATL